MKITILSDVGSSCDYEEARKQRLECNDRFEEMKRCQKMRNNKGYSSIMSLMGQGANPTKKEK